MNADRGWQYSLVAVRRPRIDYRGPLMADRGPPAFNIAGSTCILLFSFGNIQFSGPPIERIKVRGPLMDKRGPRIANRYSLFDYRGWQTADRQF